MSDKDVFDPDITVEEPENEVIPQAPGSHDPFDVPFELVPLPSKGKLYPEEHPLHGEEKVEIKAMSAVEENILHSPSLLKKGTMINELLRSCLVNKSIDPNDLLIGDKNAILLSIRISGFDAEYKTKTSCPECGEDFWNTFDLGKVTLKELGEKAERVDGHINLFKFTLPKSKAEVYFKLLTDREDTEISEVQKNRRKALEKFGKAPEVDTTVTDRLAKQIKRIKTPKKDIEDPAEIGQMVQQMPAKDAKALRKHALDIEPNVVMKQEAQCTSCGEEDEVDIPMSTDFFWPEE